MRALRKIYCFRHERENVKSRNLIGLDPCNKRKSAIWSANFKFPASHYNILTYSETSNGRPQPAGSARLVVRPAYCIHSEVQARGACDWLGTFLAADLSFSLFFIGPYRRYSREASVIELEPRSAARFCLASRAARELLFRFPPSRLAMPCAMFDELFAARELRTALPDHKWNEKCSPKNGQNVALANICCKFHSTLIYFFEGYVLLRLWI